MKLFLTLSALVAVALAAEFYDSKYDSFNAQELVDNKRLLKSYTNCFLEKGPCTSEGTDFKRIIPEALSNDCAKCTPKQRVLVRTVANAMKNQFPELWEELKKKEDPEGKYQETLTKFLASTN